MQSFRCLRLLSPTATASPSTALLRPSIPQFQSPKSASTIRHLSILTPRRPQLTFTPILPSLTTPSTISASTQETLDLLPKISAHPGLATQQIRCGPRDTFNPSHFVRKRRHGFLARLRSRTGRKILKRRQAKGRYRLSH